MINVFTQSKYVHSPKQLSVHVHLTSSFVHWLDVCREHVLLLPSYSIMCSVSLDFVSIAVLLLLLSKPWCETCMVKVTPRFCLAAREAHYVRGANQSHDAHSASGHTSSPILLCFKSKVSTTSVILSYLCLPFFVLFLLSRNSCTALSLPPSVYLHCSISRLFTLSFHAPLIADEVLHIV